MNDVEVLQDGEHEYSLGDKFYKCLCLPAKNATKKRKYNATIQFIGKLTSSNHLSLTELEFNNNFLNL